MLTRDDLTVVGGGQSAKYLLLALAHAIAGGRLRRTFRIGIYEESDACGPGWAWNPTNADEIHLSSLPTPVRRAAVGRDEPLKFERAIAFLRELGADVDVRCSTHVAAIDAHGSDWRVKDSAGMERNARNVVLAIGHSAFGERRPDGVSSTSPWPFEALCDQVDKHAKAGPADVLVIGGYLTAVDVITGLAARFGTDPARLRIRMLSRSGELPKVWGREPPTIDYDAVAHRAFGADVSGLRACGRFGFDVFERIVLDAAYEADTTNERMASLSALLRRLCAGDAAQRLKADLADTASGETLGWQAVLFNSLPLLSEGFHGFDDTEKLHFRRLRSRYYRAAMPMARENASCLITLFDAGVLTVRAAPHDFHIEHGAMREGNCFTLAGNADESRVVVAAAGPDTRIEHTPSQLLRHLQRRGMAQPAYVHANGETFELGGVLIDPATCEMVAPNTSAAAGLMFAMGPLVVGTFPDAQSIGHIARDAERIVERLVQFERVT